MSQSPVGPDSQINNMGLLSHSTHTNMSNPQLTSNRQQQLTNRQSNPNDECVMSFETKDARQKDGQCRSSLNAFEDSHTEINKNRRSSNPYTQYQRDKPYQPVLSHQRPIKMMSEHRDTINRINQ